MAGAPQDGPVGLAPWSGDGYMSRNEPTRVKFWRVIREMLHGHYGKRGQMRLCALTLASIVLSAAGAPVEMRQDGPKPRPVAESQRAFQVGPGYRVEIIASEPLIMEPTGVCWDERGRMHVCELHGYNLEGQLEIEEMNRAGQLDTKVQRVQAADRFKEAAQAGTYGVLKRLSDRDGDGVMDHAEVLASNLPPAYGICPARGGIILAGQAEILFLADRDDDGVAEVREVLFHGWKRGALERGINAPQWGPDGWIYVGRGWGANEAIRGPYLPNPVRLPNTDFRIRSDGSAIEPVGAGTHTIGLAFTPEGDRFFTTTWKHALYAVPIPWRYFARNPDAAAPSLEADASDYTTVFPVAPVHPWKRARSSLPGWKELYGGYGIAESAESGFFTSCCSPLIYQGEALPEEIRGNLLVCEPAQSLIHRSIIERDGPALHVRRAPGERQREFLASADAWFRPVSLAHAPDGTIAIVDMYREIIEDYSAVPRFMQQQYGLNGGVKHGRIWRLAHSASTQQRGPAGPENMATLKDDALARELDRSNYWRRQTADRLLRERTGNSHPALTHRAGKLEDVLELLDRGAGALGRDEMANRVVELLRFHDAALLTNTAAAKQLAARVPRAQNGRVLLQLALSLGYSPAPEAFQALAYLAREHLDVRWMAAALMTGLHERSGRMLAVLLRADGPQGEALLGPLAASVAARGDEGEVSAALVAIAEASSPSTRAAALSGFGAVRVEQLTPAGERAVRRLVQDEHAAVRAAAIKAGIQLKLAEDADLESTLRRAAADAADPGLSSEERLAAVRLLAQSEKEDVAKLLLAAWSTSTPLVRVAILDALISRSGRIGAVVDALEDGTLPVTALNRQHRGRLLERANSHQRPRLEAVFARDRAARLEIDYEPYMAALAAQRDVMNGKRVFNQLCAACHRVGEIGTAVGPNLTQTFQRSEAALVRDVLAPNESIASGYESYTVRRTPDDELTGVLVSDSATSVTLRLGGGVEETILRKDIVQLRSSEVSLMPEGLGDALPPKDCADLLAWIRETLAGQLEWSKSGQ